MVIGGLLAHPLLARIAGWLVAVLAGWAVIARLRSAARAAGRREAEHEAAQRAIDAARRADEAVDGAGPHPRLDRRVRRFYRDG